MPLCIDTPSSRLLLEKSEQRGIDLLSALLLYPVATIGQNLCLDRRHPEPHLLDLRVWAYQFKNALSLPDQKDQVLPLQVALIRDLRRRVPDTPPEDDPNEDPGLPPWWRESWQAVPAKAEPTTAKLIPIVTTATYIDAVELAQTYIRRWPLQENVIKNFLLPLGLDINHGYGKTPVPNSEVSKKRAALEKRLSDIQKWAPAARERSNKASARHRRLWKETKAKGEARYRILDEQLQNLQAQGVTPGQWKTERNRLQGEAQREMQELWDRVSRVLETCNKEYAKWETLLSRTRGSLTCSGGSGSTRANDVLVGQPQGPRYDGLQARPGQPGHVDS